MTELLLCDGEGGTTVGEPPEVLWVVVRVESGIPVMAEAYADEMSAILREEHWRRSMSADNDETGVFAAEVRRAPPSFAAAQSPAHQVE